MAESFLDTFKTELIAHRVWQTRTQLELAIVEYIAWSNNTPLHETLSAAESSPSPKLDCRFRPFTVFNM